MAVASDEQALGRDARRKITHAQILETAAAAGCPFAKREGRCPDMCGCPVRSGRV